MHPIADLVTGALLLVLGRKLFWLFVAIAGFYAGIEVVRVLLAGQPSWVMWVAGAATGLIGALLAMLFQRVGFALGGFYAGGYAALILAERFAPGAVGGATFVIGGVVGALFAVWLMDWAIIVLSSLVGAVLVVTSLGLRGAAGFVVYVVLAALGIALQAWMMDAMKGGPGQQRGSRE
ncbi:MAG TPA: DUF4203 domain-containing protein [Burkholderiales bacterium]|nr:DUF4203 domain-containing protein [Burkholderiales bacterium]